MARPSARCYTPAPSLVSIELTPADPEIEVGKTQQFKAVGRYLDKSTKDLTAAAKWTSSSPGVATITSGGLAAAIGPGKATIEVSSNSITASTTLTVRAVPSKLVSIAITPDSPSTPAGKTLQLKAMGTDSNGSQHDLTESATWSSLEPNIATVSQAGLVTAISQGQATIQVTSGSITKTTVLVVSAPVPASIAVSFSNPAAPPSKSQQLLATGTYTDGSSQDLTEVATWTSLAESIATVTKNGLVNSVAPGRTTIQVSSGGATGSITLTVSTRNEIAAPVIPQASIQVSPQVIQPVGGKLPSSVNVAVFVKDCEKSGINLNGYSLMITGGGLSFSRPTAGQCVMTSILTIDASAAPGTFAVVLRDNNNNPVATSDFAILESTAGAIPNGLVPQVDVMYQVLTQGVCVDVFGKRVAHNFYCIEVKIGNNTGHPLQIAGIGFSRHIDQLPGNPLVTQANTSYASTRAVLLREEVLSPRNVFYHSVQATGIIMASLNPFFHAPNASRNFAVAASIVSGPLLAAIGIVGPDRVVGQLNNLDDESFRDSQIIPNNTHIRTMVFIEKRALTEALTEVSSQYVQELQKRAAETDSAANALNQAQTGNIAKSAEAANLTKQPDLTEAKKLAADQAKNAMTSANTTIKNS